MTAMNELEIACDCIRRHVSGMAKIGLGDGALDCDDIAELEDSVTVLLGALAAYRKAKGKLWQPLKSPA